MSPAPDAFIPVTVDVIITNPAGKSLLTTADRFTYQDATVPTITSVTPSSGTSAGGTTIALVGTGFTGATSVRVGGTECTGVHVTNDTHMEAVTPLHVAGQFHTRVTTPAGTSAPTANDFFTFADAAPVVTAVTPNAGSSAGGDTVVIAGSNFQAPDVTGVFFGLVAAASFTVDSDIQITAVTSAVPAQTVDVVVLVGAVNSELTPADQFTFEDVVNPPTITSVTPNSGSAAGGDSVILDGTNLSTVTAIRFGLTNAPTFTLDSPTVGRITVTTPTHVAKTIHVEVDNPDGTSAHSAADRFTFTSVTPPSAPNITGVTPDHGVQAGGTTVVVTGTDFGTIDPLDPTAVQFDTTNAASFTVDSPTQVTCVSPPHAAATVDIRLKNPAGTSGIVPEDAYTYPDAPTVSAVAPSHGPVTGGTTVVVTGTNFEE